MMSFWDLLVEVSGVSGVTLGLETGGSSQNKEPSSEGRCEMMYDYGTSVTAWRHQGLAFRKLPATGNGLQGHFSNRKPTLVWTGQISQNPKSMTQNAYIYQNTVATWGLSKKKILTQCKVTFSKEAANCSHLYTRGLQCKIINWCNVSWQCEVINGPRTVGSGRAK